MEFEKVRDIIVETLGCDAEGTIPPAVRLHEERIFHDQSRTERFPGLF